MTKKSTSLLIMPVIMGLCCIATNADAKSVYTNNVSAINLNMLTQQFMSYAHQGELISDIILDKSKVYGTMTRLDEYGDDGRWPHGRKDDFQLEKLVWLDAKHLNTVADYSDNVSDHRTRLYTETIGINTNNIDINMGSVAFGAFLGAVTENSFGLTSNGFTFGVMSRYNYQNFGVTAMLNNGSVNKNNDDIMFNNAWFNAALDTSINLRVNDDLFIRPTLYAGYTYVSAEKMVFDTNKVPPKDFRFINLAPSIEVFGRLAQNLYATASAKYVQIYGDTDKNVYVNNTLVDQTSADNYVEFGIGLEYDYKSFVFTGNIQKQINGFDSWGGDLGVKYLF